MQRNAPRLRRSVCYVASPLSPIQPPTCCTLPHSPSALRRSVYYVASPEACAAILWKSRDKAGTVRGRGAGSVGRGAVRGRRSAPSFPGPSIQAAGAPRFTPPTCSCLAGPACC